MFISHETENYVTSMFTDLDTEDCSYEIFPVVSERDWKGMAYNNEGTKYHITDNSYAPNHPQGEFSFVYWIPAYTYDLVTTAVTSDDLDHIEGLTCTANTLVYFIGDRLCKWDGNTNFFTNYGILPDNLKSPGGITYRAGEVYFSTFNNDIVKLDPENVTESEVMFTLPTTVPPIQAMTTVHNSCSDIVTYGTVADEEGTTFYIIDFENGGIVEHCSIVDDSLTAITNLLEPIVPPCELYIDLNPNTFFYNHTTDSICTAPVNITGAYADVYSELDYVDSITVSLASGVMNAEEYLTIENFSDNLNMTGAGTPEIILRNNGEANSNDFAAALTEILYNNDADNIVYGLRTIDLSVFSSVYSNSNTKAVIPLFNEALQFNPQINTPSCVGDSDGTLTLLPDGGHAPYTFTWQDGTATPNLTDLAAGNYSVTVSDSEGCIRADAVNLPDPLPLQLQINNNGQSAVCDTFGILSAQPGGGIPPYAYLWSNGKTDAVASGFSSGNHTLTLTDANGCQTTADYFLAPGTGSQTDINDSFCEGETYLFADYTITNDTSFCLTLTDVQGCDSLVCLDLTLLSDSYTEESVSLCQGENFTLDGQSFTQDTFVCIDLTTFAGCDSTVCYEVVFFGSTDFIDAEICAGDTYFFNSENLNTAGTYQNVLPDANGCDSIINLTLSVNELPQTEIIQNGNLCTDDEAELTTTEPFVNYTWSNGIAAAAVYVNQAGTYAVTVTDENGCINTATTEVLDTNFTFSAVGEDPSCTDDTDGVILIQTPSNGTPPYLFSLNGGAFVTDTVLSNLPSGIYQITAEDAAGCTGTFSITLQNPPPINLNLPTEANLTLGDSLRIDLQNAGAWQSVQWTPPAATSCDTCLQTWLRPTWTTRYTVTATDAGGCTDTQSILLTVDARLDLYAPTAFSPDNNGINDIFYLQSKNDLPVEQMQIFDRWGNLHFSSAPGYTNDPGIGWDGIVRSGVIAQGVYVWTVRVILPDGERRFLSGEVSVL